MSKKRKLYVDQGDQADWIKRVPHGVLASVQALEFYSDDQPRDDHGRWSSGGGSDSSASETPHGVRGIDFLELAHNLPGANTPIEKQMRVLLDRIAAGEKVIVTKPQVSVLSQELIERVREAKAAGEDPPNIDLCSITVPGTNYFCADNLGVPRVDMPQLSSKVENFAPDSNAILQNLPVTDRGEIDLAQPFIGWLQNQGVGVEQTTVPAGSLRATQTELNGAKVAGMADALSAGTLPPGSIFTSNDGYVLDGHHRWAASLTEGYTTGDPNKYPMAVKQIDLSMRELLPLTLGYTQYMGIPNASVFDPKPTGGTTASIQALEFYSDDEPRDESGKWTSSGGEPRLAPLESGPTTKNAGRALPFEQISMKGLPKELQAKVMNTVRTKIASTQKINASFDHFMETAWNDPAIREAGMKWYQEQHDVVHEIAGNNDLEPQNVAAAFAAMSPGTQWDVEEPIIRTMAEMDKENVELSDEKLALLNEKIDVMSEAHPEYELERVENGDPYAGMNSRQAVIAMQSQAMEQRNAEGDGPRASWGVGYGYGNFAKGLDLMRGADVDDTLVGPKVRSFTNNIMDPSDPRDVTIDVHMIQGSARDPNVVNDSGVMGSPSYQGASIGAYPYIADVVRRVADDYGIIPNQAQALIWLGYKAEHGVSFNGSKGV